MNEKIKRQQMLLSILSSSDGNCYYIGKIDGLNGEKTKDGAKKFLTDYGFETEIKNVVTSTESKSDYVMVFSLAKDGEKLLSSNFKVKEFACHDGTDVILIHSKLPDTCETARVINGAFVPGSSYRHPSYNASIGGAKNSRHMYGDAVDIPARNATPEQLYELMEPYVGDKGGLGIYDWGIHVDWRGVKARWDSRTK